MAQRGNTNGCGRSEWDAAIGRDQKSSSKAETAEEAKNNVLTPLTARERLKAAVAPKCSWAQLLLRLKLGSLTVRLGTIHASSKQRRLTCEGCNVMRKDLQPLEMRWQRFHQSANPTGTLGPNSAGTLGQWGLHYGFFTIPSRISCPYQLQQHGRKGFLKRLRASSPRLWRKEAPALRTLWRSIANADVFYARFRPSLRLHHMFHCDSIAACFPPSAVLQTPSLL